MQTLLGGAGGKRARGKLVRRYGFGVPHLDYAIRSAKDALTLVAQATIRPFLEGTVNATMDTLEPDTEVHFTDIYLVTGGRVPRMMRRVRDFMTKGGIVVYTLAMDDAPAPSAGNAVANQRHFLEMHGIYIHSKTAVLIDDDNTAHTSATTGSANLTPRSLDAPDRDSEVNVWWHHHDRIRLFFETLVREHTGGPTDSYSIQEAGLEALNRIRTGRQPGRHLVRLDLADRKLHKD